MPNNESLAFEPFGSLDNVLTGGPIKIMPLGTFYRDNRKLEITEADLREIEKNVAAGLPRFRIPINENHQGIGKVGTVKAVQYMDAGADGPGLYAIEYELTDEGKKLVAAKRFDAVSPEVIWKKNGGAMYQDPNTGKQINNVLVGLALTDRPFFGHDNVALFSAMPIETRADITAAIAAYKKDPSDAERERIIKSMFKLKAMDLMPEKWSADLNFNADNMAADIVLAHKKLMAAAKLHQGHIDGTEPTSESSQEKLMNLIDSAMRALGMGSDDMAADMPSLTPAQKRHNGFTKLKATFREKLNAWLNELKDEDGDGEPDAMPEVMPMTATLIETASVAMNTSDPTAPAPAPADNDPLAQGKDNMADVIQLTAPAAPEKFNISAEEFAALKAKTEKVDAIELAATKQAETFAAQLKATEARALAIERAARLSQMQAHCETFSAIPLQATELAEKFMALEEKDADLFKYFDTLLTTLDNQVAQAGLFSQVTSPRAAANVETYEAFASKLHKERFGNDPAKLSEAYNVAAKERPDLYRTYDETYTTRRKGE